MRRQLTYGSEYSSAQIDAWAGRVKRWLREGRDVHVYFDNDARGHAPRNALQLIDRIAARSRRSGSAG